MKMLDALKIFLTSLQGFELIYLQTTAHIKRCLMLDSAYFGLKNRCVSAKMPKKIRVGRSENLLIFLPFFIL